jgi:multiple antibiotic resistance protein
MSGTLEEKFLRDLLMLWTTLDPIGALSVFAGLTASLEARERNRIALRAIVYAALILICAVVAGQILLDAMGIKLVSLRVAGGIILLLFGLQMVFGSLTSSLHAKSEAGYDMAVYPLAVPAIAGPGSIVAAIVLTDNDVHSIPVQAGTSAILLFILLVMYLLMLAAGRILRVIGHSGAAILIRIMGIILSALSVQILMEALNVPGWS